MVAQCIALCSTSWDNATRAHRDPSTHAQVHMRRRRWDAGAVTHVSTREAQSALIELDLAFGVRQFSAAAWYTTRWRPLSPATRLGMFQAPSLDTRLGLSYSLVRFRYKSKLCRVESADAYRYLNDQRPVSHPQSDSGVSPPAPRRSARFRHPR